MIYELGAIELQRTLVCNLFLWPNIQGTESSDLSLISDFFTSSRTILEISVNLKRIF